MRFTFTARRITLTPAIRAYAEKKISKLFERLTKSKEVAEPLTVDIELSRETRHHHKGKIWQAEATLVLPRQKKPLHVSATDEDMYAAVDLLAEEVERGLERYRGRLSAVLKRSARALKRVFRFNPLSRFRRTDRVREEGR